MPILRVAILMDLWNSFWSLEWYQRRLVMGCAVALIAATVMAWRVMLPLWSLAALVALYLRFTRDKEGL